MILLRGYTKPLRVYIALIVYLMVNYLILYHLLDPREYILPANTNVNGLWFCWEGIPWQNESIPWRDGDGGGGRQGTNKSWNCSHASPVHSSQVAVEHTNPRHSYLPSLPHFLLSVASRLWKCDISTLFPLDSFEAISFMWRCCDDTPNPGAIILQNQA